MANRFSKAEEKKAEEDSKSKKNKKRDKEEDNDFGNHIDTPLLLEYMSVQGNTMIVLRGVGLVTGLNGTGGDPSPSALRTQLQNEMNRRGVKDSKKILASRDTAMVVRYIDGAFDPAGRTGDQFAARGRPHQVLARIRSSVDPRPGRALRAHR